MLIFSQQAINPSHSEGEPKFPLVKITHQHDFLLVTLCWISTLEHAVTERKAPCTREQDLFCGCLATAR